MLFVIYDNIFTTIFTSHFGVWNYFNSKRLISSTPSQASIDMTWSIVSLEFMVLFDPFFSLWLYISLILLLFFCWCFVWLLWKSFFTLKTHWLLQQKVHVTSLWLVDFFQYFIYFFIFLYFFINVLLSNLICLKVGYYQYFPLLPDSCA